VPVFDTPPQDLVGRLLALAFRQQLMAPDAETGIAIVRAQTGMAGTEAAWHSAVASALRDGLIHDPVRLPPGALQCHWHVELTPAGVAAFRHAARTTDRHQRP
jgi:hypothetical protein